MTAVLVLAGFGVLLVAILVGLGLAALFRPVAEDLTVDDEDDVWALWASTCHENPTKDGAR